MTPETRGTAVPKPEILHFNVFNDPYTPDPRPIFNGVPSSVRPLYRSPDERVIVTSRKYPEGADYREVFYLVDGSVTCTPDGGEPIVFERGEVIYYPAGVAARWEYSPRSQHLAVFWGEQPIGLTAPRPS
jgi:uncharacterized cupin superfamily protein